MKLQRKLLKNQSLGRWNIARKNTVLYSPV